ncbi:MAG: ATP-dependent helicase/nuclease subunit B [Saprospiraceae bacterium]|jgi:ATP-dependent helicase/nuclease subunit B
MTIYFGLQFDEEIYPKAMTPEGGVHYFGPQGLLFMLESHLGLIGHPTDNEHIRIEQFRQAIRKHLADNPETFYARSFAADQLATAGRLLQLRDQLKLAGWNFEVKTETPSRLRIISEMAEISSKSEKGLSPGFADRFTAILTTLALGNHPIKKLFHNEPLSLLPDHYKKLFTLFQDQGIAVAPLPDVDIKGATNLDVFKKFLLRKNKDRKTKLSADGSLFILKAKRETEAATFLAKLFEANPSSRPLCVIPEKNRALDNAVIQEGLPSFGILSASLARPSLQILKLAPAFLWHPIDPYKVMEFVSLSLKPLDDELAEVIANLMAQNPGLNSDTWRYQIGDFFKNLNERAQQDKSIDAKKIRAEFDFWFDRRRFDASQTVPKSDVIKIFKFIGTWVREVIEKNNLKNSSLLVLGEQSKRIVDLLEALPEGDEALSNLELERIVRTIYKPSPVTFTDTAVGHLPFVYNSSAVIAPVEEVVWWNFSSLEQEHFFSNWYDKELKYLQAKDIRLQTPKDENALLLWQRPRSILQTQGRVFLVISDKVDGSDVFPHPLYDELTATFDDLSPITYHVNGQNPVDNCLEAYFNIPKQETLGYRQLGKPKPFIYIDQAEKFGQQPEETFTSLDSLFYYPYQWVFRHKIKLRKSSILSIVKDVTLMGNLAHRFFEMLFAKEGVEDWTKEQVELWIDEEAYGLLSKEGAVLLLYGREPERVAFINRVKYAIWSLLVLIKNNGWTVEGTEKKTGGDFLGIPVKGKVDMVLKRGQELMVIDLKWRGAAFRERMIKNEEDLQLVTYSRLLTKDENWAHTAYFIIENGKAIARNNLGFKEITGAAPESNHLEVNLRIWKKMEDTFEWRMAQLKKGTIEIRTEQTIGEIEESYGDQLLDLLEMKDRDAPFDDYRTLINLVE